MNSTVLIQGETGTGKELIARTIHHNSPRARSAVRRVQRRGDSRGAGRSRAVRPRQGRVHRRGQRARRPLRAGAPAARCSSTKSRSMSLALQAKLLRALQEREIERVGESRPIKFDIRVIAATNVDLQQDGQGRHVPRGPLLPAERRADHAAAAARRAARTSRCWPSTSSRSRASSNGLPPRTHQPGRAARADGLRVAGQHPPARERHRARRRDERRREREITPAMLPEDMREPAQSTIAADGHDSRRRASTSRRWCRSSNAS